MNYIKKHILALLCSYYFIDGSNAQTSCKPHYSLARSTITKEVQEQESSDSDETVCPEFSIPHKRHDAFHPEGSVASTKAELRLDYELKGYRAILALARRHESEIKGRLSVL